METTAYGEITKNIDLLMPDKTIYVLGAGFSCPAGLPAQAAIYSGLKALEETEFRDKFPFAGSEFYEAKTTTSAFTSSIFPGVATPLLEDVFTLLDLSISRGEYCGPYSWLELYGVRENIRKAIILYLFYCLAKIDEDKQRFYRTVAAHIINERIKRELTSDPVSIVALNWDSLLEDSIYDVILDCNAAGQIDVDFCCYTTPYGESPHTSSIGQKASNIFNIKLCKLHGSINWLRCPNCDRLFTGVGAPRTIWQEYFTPTICPKCSEGWIKQFRKKGPILEHFLITPTYAKVFDSPHIRMVWHNAHVEFSEAKRIVFIGYSLPEADYHVRALLRRSISEGTEIEVVLPASAFPPQGTAQNIRTAYAATRYEEFFGQARVQLHHEGAEEYFEKTENIMELNKRKGVLRRRLRNIKGQSKNS